MKALFISAALGLGHAGRDLAIADELTRLRPDIEIDWLAGDPAAQQLSAAGARLLPECADFQETSLAEQDAGGFSLNMARFMTHAALEWARIARTAIRLVEKNGYDLVVGDETYGVAIAFALRPSLKRVPFAIIYDFFGLDAMSGKPVERTLVGAVTWRWGGRRHAKAPPFDLVLFVGEPEDIADRPLGRGLANRRAYAVRHFAFLGYVLGFDAPRLAGDRAAIRAALGYDERPLIICSVGGTAIGRNLLGLCNEAYPHIQERVPDAHMVLVCGPRIDPATIPAPSGVEVHGYIPRLYEHFAACDVAIVQAGGTSTLELTALRRPFAYFPLQHHAEQNVTVAGRLRRHGAGERCDYTQTTPQTLADTVTRLLGSTPAWAPIPTDGARRAAELLAGVAPA